MKHINLPKYWIVKMPSNPSDLKFREIIDFLNETYGSDWAGDCMTYYGYDGNSEYGGSDCSDTIEYFKNDPVLITVDDWHNCANQIAEYEIY